MSFAIGLRNGFCFGLDIVSAHDDLVYQGGHIYVANGIVFTIACIHVIIGSFEYLEEGPDEE